MGWVFGRRRRRRYVRRLRSHKDGFVALLVAIALALAVGATHLAIARPVEPDSPAVVRGLRDQSPLLAAFAATFGSPYGALKRVGARDEATWFTPGVIVEAPFGAVLISQGDVVAPDLGSTGKLAVVYLDAQALTPRRIFMPAIESGVSGQIYDWRVRSGLDRYPLVEVEGRATLADRSCAWTSWIELAPEGPRELAVAPRLDARAAKRISLC